MVIWLYVREELNVWTVPTFKIHYVGTVPTSKLHNVGIVPTFRCTLIQTVGGNLTPFRAFRPFRTIQTIQNDFLASIEER